MKILIVEDNEKLAASLKKGCEQEGYAVDVLGNGETALRRLGSANCGCDLVILDIMLPGKNGIEVCKELRGRGSTIPILMLTARDATGDRVAGLDAGADDYLVKPFAFEELLARVRALLRRPREAVPVSLSLGGIVLDSASRTVAVGSTSIPLTLREYAVLEYLMRHPNQVLTREQILANVWDFSFDAWSNVVDVHVKNVRKKLGTIHGKSITTIRGVGYRFAA
jgi:two-component system OmpR family response regulator